MIERRREMGGRNLPYDAEIEYLECSGTQWIDTGIKSGPPMESIIKVQKFVEDNKTVVGSRNPTRFYFLHFYQAWCYGLYNYHANNTVAVRDTAIHVVESVLHEGEQSFKLDGQVLMTNTDSGTFTDNTTVLLFKNNTRTRLHFVKLYKSNALIADFIPVRVGQVGYMYDKVSKQLFGNAGTGNFKLGLDKNRNENITYVESPVPGGGHQSIDVITGKQAQISIYYNTVVRVPWTNDMVSIQYKMGDGWYVSALVPCTCNNVTYNEGDLIAHWGYYTTIELLIEAII